MGSLTQFSCSCACAVVYASLRVYMCTLYISGLSFCVLFQPRKIAYAEEKCLTSLSLSLTLPLALGLFIVLNGGNYETQSGWAWVCG